MYFIIIIYICLGFAKKRLLKDGVVPTINMGSIKNVKLHEQRSRRIERRENKKSVNLLLEKHSSDLIPSQENYTLPSVENTDTIENIDIKMEKIYTIENIDIKMENIDEIESHQTPEKQRNSKSVSVIFPFFILCFPYYFNN